MEFIIFLIVYVTAIGHLRMTTNYVLVCMVFYLVRVFIRIYSELI